MVKRIFASLFACATFSASAGCKEIHAAIENALKEAADIEVRSEQPFATVHQRVANQLATVNANVMLLDRGKCPMPQEPVGVGNLNPYITAAKQCARVATGDCNREAWKRSQP